MNKTKLIIHPQLKADTLELFKYKHYLICLHKNACLPWLIIIPDTTLKEFHELPTNSQNDILSITKVASQYFKQRFGAEKINFAAIGNVVQQLHIHVIGRHSDDPLWPDVVWGNKLPEQTYTVQEVDSIKTELLALVQGENT